MMDEDYYKVLVAGSDVHKLLGMEAVSVAGLTGSGKSTYILLVQGAMEVQ